MNRRSAFTLVELVIVIAIIGILASLVIGGCNYFGSMSEGYRDGYVQKFSYKGRWKKGWEGELAQPGFGGGASPAGNAWAFSVADTGIVEELKKCTARDFVRLHYTETAWNWGHDTNYNVTKIERLDAER